MPKGFALQDGRNTSRKRYGSLLARLVVAAAAILWVLRGQDWRELVRVFHSLSPWYFLLSLIVYAAAQVIISIRWWLLLRAQSIHIRVRMAVRLFFLGLFYNNFLPGAVTGDLLKAWYVTKHTDKRLEGALSVLVDRLVGLGGLILMAAFTYVVLVRGRVAGGARGGPAGLAASFSQYRVVFLWTAIIVAAALAGGLAHPEVRTRLVRAARDVWQRGLLLLRRGKETLVVYCSKPWTLLWALGLTVIGQSTVIVAFWLLGRNLGVEAGLAYYFFIFPVMWVVGAIPISIAGLGITEAGIVGLFTLLTGATAERVLALAFCQRFIWVLSSLPGGLVHLLGAHLPRPGPEISIDGRERAN